MDENRRRRFGLIRKWGGHGRPSRYSSDALVKNDPYSPRNERRVKLGRGLLAQARVWWHLSYFMSKPGTFKLQQLTFWRQLEAYNYFKNSHVRPGFSSTRDSGWFVVLMAKVNPSQRAPDLAHEAWIIARKDGTTVSTHCTLQGWVRYLTVHSCSRMPFHNTMCSFKFKVECGVRLGYTSARAQWCT